MNERETYSNSELLGTRLTLYELRQLRTRVPLNGDERAKIPIVENGVERQFEIPFTPLELEVITKGQEALDQVLSFLTPTPDTNPYEFTDRLDRYPRGRDLLQRERAVNLMIMSTNIARDILTALQMFPQTETVTTEVMPPLRTLIGIPRAAFQASKFTRRR